ncbi:MAG: response regulator, partial [Armatimonadota bacterium]|nr:response regulator [Armatimonadota bacterium]
MLEEFIKNARFLIVDDEPINIALLEQMLERWECLNVVSTSDSREVLALYQQSSPDIILLDLMMPHLDGFQVMEQLKPLIANGVFLPILVLTADITSEAKRRALASGAKDFLTKPFDPTELLLRIRNLLETRFLHLQLQNQNQILDLKVQERTRDLEASRRNLDEAQIEILERLAKAAEYRDDDTGQHTHRVGLTSTLLAQNLGLATERVELLRRAAPLHDVGKIGIPDEILLKPGRLTPEEFDIIKTHSAIGAALLSGGRSDLVQMAASIALTHHERWDGTGYPRGIAGEAIPIEGRIVAIVDVFDALTHDRPYKKAWPLEEALAEIARQDGRQFDPRIVE